MSDASFQRSRVFHIATARAPGRPMPAGYGLMLGATASLALWSGLFWLGARLVG